MLIGIYCCDNNGGISKDNSIPWHNKEELMWFRKVTINNNIFMGRKTFEALKCKPLDNRKNFVISKTLIINIPNVKVLENIEEIYTHNDTKFNFIIGGKSIIDQTYKKCNYLFVSFLKENYNCDLKIKIDYFYYFKLEKILAFKTFVVFVWRNKTI